MRTMRRCRRPVPAALLLGLVGALGVLGVLGGCASGPGKAPAGAEWSRDGAEPNPPPGLADVPDAEPRLEVIRPGGPNKPYEVLGHAYVPITQDAAYTERGLASWYGRKFQGRRTSSGELYNMYAMTAAHPTLPIPSYARIRNPANGREVVVRINDRGPFHSERVIDLSYTAALKLDLLRGTAPVELQRITFEDIRTGAWRRDTAAGDLRLAARDAEAPVVAPAMAAAANAPLPEGVVPLTSVPASGNSAGGVRPPPNPPPATSVDSSLAAPVVAVAAAARDEPLPPVADAAPARAFTEPGRGFWVQLGAFRQRDGAEGFQRRVSAELDWLAPLMTLFSDTSLFRLQAGPYPSRDEARSAAERIRDALRLVPVVVERR